MLTEREQVASTARRVLDEYRSSGALPGPLVTFIKSASFKRSGHIPTDAEVERHVTEWAAKWLAEMDNGAAPDEAATE